VRVEEVEKKVFEWVDRHQDEIADFLKSFIRHKSPTGKELVVQRDFLRPFLEKMGFDQIDYFSVSPEAERPNLNGIWKGRGGGRNLLFSGHVDVIDVSPEALKRWTKDPWEPALEGGKIYGRGSNDMKGGDTAMVWATKALMDSGIRLKGDLLVSCVIGEERNQAVWGAIPATKRLQEKGIDISFCVDPEPTNNEIHIVSAASFRFSITITGKEVHTSMKNVTQYPQRYGIPVGSQVGVDAIVIMVDLLERLRRLELQWNLRHADPIVGGGGYPVQRDMQGVGVNSINCTLLEGGTDIASVPGYSRVTGHVFYSPRFNPGKLWDEIKGVVHSLAATYDWLKEHPPEIERDERFDFPAYEVPPDHPGVKAMAEAYERVTGEKAILSGFKAVADAAHLQRECNVDTVLFGPGNLHMGTHGPDEYIPIDQLITATKTLAAMAIRWCGLAK